MHCLIKGNFPEVSQLKVKYKPKDIHFFSDFIRIAEEVVDNLSSIEIDRFAVEVCEIYKAAVSEEIMRKIIFEKVNLSAKFGNKDEMKNAVSITEVNQ